MRGTVFQSKYQKILKWRCIYWNNMIFAFWQIYQIKVSLWLKQEQISANGLGRIKLIQRENKFAFPIK